MERNTCLCCGRRVGTYRTVVVFCGDCVKHLGDWQLPDEEQTYNAQHGEACPFRGQPNPEVEPQMGLVSHENHHSR